MRTISTVIRVTLLSILVGVSISFTVGNQQRLAITLPPLDVVLHMPLYLFGGMVFAIGTAAGVLTSIAHYSRKLATLRRRLKQNEKATHALQQQLQSQQAEILARTRMAQAITKAS
jgi:ABC-type proline/glycine betaine transport system permease subunit